MGDREREIEEISRQYGAPAIRHCLLEVSRAGLDWWVRASQKRYGEVVLFILRSSGNLLLHSKDFYPAGAVRAPSGTIKENEPLLEAVQREGYEETGLLLSVERFLAVVRYEFHFQQHSMPFSSYLFLLREVGGELHAVDTSERISGFGETPIDGLVEVAERLENLPPDRLDWGRFRAYPHRLAAELLSPRCNGFDRSQRLNSMPHGTPCGGGLARCYDEHMDVKPDV